MAAVVWSSEDRSISHGLLKTHRRCQTAAHGRGVEFRSSKFKRLGVQKAQSSKGSKFKRLKVQKARSSEGSAGRKSVNEFKNGKSACLCVRRMSAAPCAPSALPPSGRKTGRDGSRGSPRTGRRRKNFPALRRLMITRWRGGFFFFSFLLLTYNMIFCLL